MIHFIFLIVKLRYIKNFKKVQNRIHPNFKLQNKTHQHVLNQNKIHQHVSNQNKIHRRLKRL